VKRELDWKVAEEVTLESGRDLARHNQRLVELELANERVEECEALCLGEASESLEELCTAVCAAKEAALARSAARRAAM
jgi:hypothetical protein